MTGEYLLSIEQVAAKVSLGETFIRQQVRAGAFPQPITLARKVVRWRGADIDAWIREQASLGRRAS